MAACTSCKQPLSETARFCPHCATPVAFAERPTDFIEADTVAPDGLQGATPSVRPPSNQPRTHPSGWLSSSGIDHGRFEPGTVLGERYRIIARLGQGGMGEVYRADDLKLGQPVALKFLPATLERDPARLAQFHNEVRLARQIAHKNVCRMYDVGEADGLPFLTMEYVDGEDLSTLLRRIGRLPEDKALDIARQLCAGLAAAHERGVLHRDLKPANVMIDGNGQVRITDFGLAAIVGQVDQVRVGTPAYMAPEQLGGKGVSIQSDLYALGLVLYEVFTGRRAYTAQNVGELVRQHQDAVITPPSAIVRDLDAGIERAILRCLDPEPARRPRSAMAVAASLPGGDPLAAALAAGETPSPEMVAAAGERKAASMTAVLLATATLLGVLAVGVVLLARNQLSNRVPFDKSPAVLVDRAQQALAALGYVHVPVDTHWGFYAEDDYLQYVREHADYARAARPVCHATKRPAVLLPHQSSSYGSVQHRRGGVAFRSAAGHHRHDRGRDGPARPARLVPRHSSTARSAGGAGGAARLERRVPSRRARSGPIHAGRPRMAPAGPGRHSHGVDGHIGGRPETPLRLEAASWRGRISFVQTVWPWTRATRMQEAPVSQAMRVMSAVNVAFFFVLLIAALIVSRKNVKAGRGDHRGALRLVTIAAVGQLITWVFNDPHGGDPQTELNRFFQTVGEALFAGGLLYVMYLALEPAVRRYWPDSLLGWTRLVQGQVLDARVGRDVLVGLAGGALIVVLFGIRWPLHAALGHDGPIGRNGQPARLRGPGLRARALLVALRLPVNLQRDVVRLRHCRD